MGFSYVTVAEMKLQLEGEMVSVRGNPPEMTTQTVYGQLKVCIPASWGHTQVLGLECTPECPQHKCFEGKTTAWHFAQQLRGSFAKASLLTEAQLAWAS